MKENALFIWYVRLKIEIQLVLWEWKSIRWSSVISMILNGFDYPEMRNSFWHSHSHIHSWIYSHSIRNNYCFCTRPLNRFPNKHHHHNIVANVKKKLNKNCDTHRNCFFFLFVEVCLFKLKIKSRRRKKNVGKEMKCLSKK